MAETTTTSTYINANLQAANAIINKLSGYYDGFTQTMIGVVGPTDMSLTVSGRFAKMDASGIPAALNTYITEIKAITFPTISLPQPPNISNFNTPQWNESWWNTLKTNVQTFLNTATSLAETSAMELAMYQKDLARRQQTLRDMYSAANAATAKSGFLFPNSMTTGLMLDAQQKFQFDDATASRDIYKFVIEWAKSNYQYAIKSTIDAHAADYEFNMKYANALVEVYRVTVWGLIEAYKENILGTIMKMEAQIKAYNAQIEIYKINGQIDSDQCKIWIEDYMARLRDNIDSSKTMIDANLESCKARSAAATAALNGLIAVGQSASQIVVSQGA